MANEVTLTVTQGKSNMPVTNQPQLAYVLMEILPTEVMATVQMPVNFSLVLDTSGSMDGEKIERLKDAVEYVIDLLSPEDTISIIDFSSSSHVMVKSQRATSASDRAKLKAAVRKLSAGGGTEIAPALRDGLDEVKKYRSQNSIDRVILLTDGQTSNEKACLKMADSAGKDSIPVIGLGIGSDWNEDLLRDIGQRSGGEADYIAQPHEIGQYFQGVVQSMQASVVQNAVLTLHLVSGVEIRKIWRVLPAISDLGYSPISGHGVIVPLGELEKTQGQALMAELLLPSRQAGTYRIAQAEVAYDVPMLNLTQEKARGDVVMSFTHDPVLSQQANPRVMNIVEKVTAFKLQTRALSEMDAGNIAGATQKLRAAATILLNQGEADLAKTVRLEADQLEKTNKMSSEGKKTIQFKGGKTVRLSDLSSDS